ncbi:hypothetical protein [Olleya sp. ITB9]|uniref:hypothetical protein n=1 Tax=Olleya sp. ITB9 TaxID=1715648 RepID=UPI0006D203F5|nr:hypothetical protein [Olleya sp. ITB9]
MRKLIFLIPLLYFACSSDDETSIDNPDVSTFDVTVSQDINTAVVDQVVTLTATANETINEISYSTDNGATFPSSFSTQFGNTANLYFSFDTLGSKTIVFRVKNVAGDIADNTVTITVERGNAVQFQNVQLNSFFDMGNSWDSEYPTSNPNHLADVFFAFLKPPLNVFDGTRSGVPTSSWLWYTSAVRENETNLNWNITNENLYINPELVTPYIAFADDDGDGTLAGDLMLGPPFESIILLSNYTDTQPSSVTIQETNINLEYVIGLDW